MPSDCPTGRPESGAGHQAEACMWTGCGRRDKAGPQDRSRPCHPHPIASAHWRSLAGHQQGRTSTASTSLLSGLPQGQKRLVTEVTE